MLGLLNPGFKAIHHDPADRPVECAVLLANTSSPRACRRASTFPTTTTGCSRPTPMPRTRTTGRCCRCCSRRIPDSGSSSRRCTRSTSTRLADTYPDARFVVTHRDPVKAVASVMSLVESLTGTFSDADHHEYIAEHWPMLVEEMCNRMLDFRDANPDAVFHDMAYEHLVRDPVGAVREMYGTFGRELSPEAEQAMRSGDRRATAGRVRHPLLPAGRLRARAVPRSPSGSRATTTASMSRARGRTEGRGDALGSVGGFGDAAPGHCAATGVDGIFTFEGQHDVFFPLVLAADAPPRPVSTSRRTWPSRSRAARCTSPTPPTTSRCSRSGRFRLGLGSQIKPQIERRFGSTWSRPAARMREIVLAIKAILAGVGGRGPARLPGRVHDAHADDADVRPRAQSVRQAAGARRRARPAR